MWKWIGDNLFWIVPSLISAATIVFVVINTNKQIKNQNKESHRPYLRAVSVDDSKEHFYNAYFSVKNNEELKNEYKTVSVEILIKNIGYGTATNVFLLGFSSTFTNRAGVEEKKITGELFSTLDIDLVQESYIKVSLSSNDNFTGSIFDLILFYTDLNKNIYSTMILIEIKKNKFFNLYYYPKGSADFESILKKRNVKYKDIEKVYVKRQLGKG